MKGKEIAKFFAGFAANQVLTHGAFAAAGIQFTLFGITYSQGFNTFAVAVWAIILLLLAYYAWVKR